MVDGQISVYDWNLTDNQDGTYTVENVNTGETFTFNSDGFLITPGIKRTDANRETLSGDKTLSSTSPQTQSLDPGGVNRTVTLPAASSDLYFLIANRADAAEDITVNDNGGTKLVTLNQNGVTELKCDGTGWIAIPVDGVVT